VIHKTLPFLFSLLLFACPAFAQWTPYSASVSSETSKYVAAATHGKGSSGLAIRVVDNSGNTVARTSYTPSIDASGNVTVTWPASFTGSVKIYGAFTGTSNDRDYKADFGVTESDYGKVTVCADCTSGNYAYRELAGRRIAMGRSIVYEHGGMGCGLSQTIRVFIDTDGKVTFASSGGYGGSCNHADQCKTQTNVSSFPGDAYQIASALLTHPSNCDPPNWTGITDLR
jgi:hypothetical protein